MTGLKVLAVAAANRRVGYAYFEHKRPGLLDHFQQGRWKADGRRCRHPGSDHPVCTGCARVPEGDAVADQKQKHQEGDCRHCAHRQTQRSDFHRRAAPRKHKNKYEEARRWPKSSRRSRTTCRNRASSITARSRAIPYSLRRSLWPSRSLRMTDQNLLIAQAMG